MMEQENSKKKTTDLVKDLAERILVSEQMELVDLEFRQEGRKWVLRLFIDRESGVTLDDCVNISKQLSVALDVEDFIDRHYTLEVSSPGINRPLTKDADYIRYMGKKVRIRTSEPISGQRNFAGILSDFKNGIVTLTTGEDEICKIDMKDIIKAKLDLDIEF